MDKTLMNWIIVTSLLVLAIGSGVILYVDPFGFRIEIDGETTAKYSNGVLKLYEGRELVFADEIRPYYYNPSRKGYVKMYRARGTKYSELSYSNDSGNHYLSQELYFSKGNLTRYFEIKPDGSIKQSFDWNPEDPELRVYFNWRYENLDEIEEKEVYVDSKKKLLEAELDFNMTLDWKKEMKNIKRVERFQNGILQIRTKVFEGQAYFDPVVFTEPTTDGLSFYIVQENPSWRVVGGAGRGYDVRFENPAERVTTISFWSRNATRLLDLPPTIQITCFNSNNDEVRVTLPRRQKNVNGTTRYGYERVVVNEFRCDINPTSVYQNDSLIVYETENFQVNNTLRRWNGEEFIIALQTIWITEDGDNKKIGANDTSFPGFAEINISNTTYYNLTLYEYEWVSNETIEYLYRDYWLQYELIDLPFIDMVSGEIINTTDICSKVYSNCTFNHTDNILKVQFYEKYNDTLGMTIIDPAYSLTINSADDLIGNGTDAWRNQTNATFLGVSLEINGSTDYNKTPYYIHDEGHFQSLVWYNSTNSIYWNTTFSLADSSGSHEVEDLCDNDADCIGYWPLDYLTGDGYGDRKGGNDGTPTDTNNATGVSSEAMWFDGVNDKITIANEENFDFDRYDNFSFSMWIKPDDLSGTLEMIYGKGDWGVYTGQWVYLISGKPTFRHVGTWSQRIDVSTSTALDSTDKWYHLVVTYDGSSDVSGVQIYVNNINQAKTTNSNTLASSTLNDISPMIGSIDAVQFFGGIIDEVLIYNDTLTASEVDVLYKAGLSQHANANITLETRTADSYNLSDSDLIALWGFNNDNSTHFFDETGVYNGTLQGSIPAATEGNGTVGKGYYFDGVDDHLLLDSEFAVGPNLTLSAWVYTLNDPQDYEMILGDDGNGDYFAFRQGSDAFYFYCDGEIENYNIEDIANEWHHLTVAIESTNVYFYRDGVLIIENPDGTSSCSGFNISRIGQAYTASTELYGSIDEVRVYNRSLSASEIQNLYELGSYHIEWNSWQDEGVISDLTADTSTSGGNFFQFKPIFKTNDTDVSPYMLNYSVSPAEVAEPDEITPLWSNNKTNLTNESIEDTYVYFNITFTDNQGAGDYIFSWYNTTDWVNDSSTSWTNNTEIEVTKQIPADTGTINWTWYFDDASNNWNQTDEWSVTLDSDITAPSVDLDLNDTFIDLTTSEAIFINWTASDPQLDTVIFNISYSNGSLFYQTTGIGNVTLNASNFSISDTYQARIWANDTLGNSNTAEDNFNTIMNPTVYLYLNNSRANITWDVGIPLQYNATTILGDSDGGLILYRGGVVIDFGLSPLEDTHIPLSEGLYNMTIVYEESDHYYSGSETWWVNATTPDVFTISVVSPEAITYIVNDTDFILTTNENASVCYYDYNGTNQTMNNVNNTYFNATQELADGSYTVNYWCNTSEGENDTASVEFAVDTTPPMISLEYPLTGTVLDYLTNVPFNFTPTTEAQILDVCELYGNFTGSWALNQSNSSPVNATTNQFFLNLTEGSYLWNIECNESGGLSDFSQQGNQSFTIAILPEVTVYKNDSVINTSESIYLNWTASDTNLDSIVFNVTKPDSSLLYENTTNPGEVEFSSLVDTGIYTATLWANDSFGNEEIITTTFAVSSGAGSGITFSLSYGVNAVVFSPVFPNQQDLYPDNQTNSLGVYTAENPDEAQYNITLMTNITLVGWRLEATMNLSDQWYVINNATPTWIGIALENQNNSIWIRADLNYPANNWSGNYTFADTLIT